MHTTTPVDKDSTDIKIKNIVVKSKSGTSFPINFNPSSDQYIISLKTITEIFLESGFNITAIDTQKEITVNEFNITAIDAPKEITVKRSNPILVDCELVPKTNNTQSFFQLHYINTKSKSGKHIPVEISLLAVRSKISPEIITADNYLITRNYIEHFNIIKISPECIQETSDNIIALDIISDFCLHKDHYSNQILLFHNEFCPQKGKDVKFGFNKTDKMITVPIEIGRDINNSDIKLPYINTTILFQRRYKILPRIKDIYPDIYSQVKKLNKDMYREKPTDLEYNVSNIEKVASSIMETLEVKTDIRSMSICCSIGDILQSTKEYKANEIEIKKSSEEQEKLLQTFNPLLKNLISELKDRSDASSLSQEAYNLVNNAYSELDTQESENTPNDLSSDSSYISRKEYNDIIAPLLDRLSDIHSTLKPFTQSNNSIKYNPIASTVENHINKLIGIIFEYIEKVTSYSSFLQSIKLYSDIFKDILASDYSNAVLSLLNKYNEPFAKDQDEIYKSTPLMKKVLMERSFQIMKYLLFEITEFFSENIPNNKKIEFNDHYIKPIEDLNSTYKKYNEITHSKIKHNKQLLEKCFVEVQQILNIFEKEDPDIELHDIPKMDLCHRSMQARIPQIIITDADNPLKHVSFCVKDIDSFISLSSTEKYKITRSDLSQLKDTTKKILSSNIPYLSKYHASHCFSSCIALPQDINNPDQYKYILADTSEKQTVPHSELIVLSDNISIYDENNTIELDEKSKMALIGLPALFPMEFHISSKEGCTPALNLPEEAIRENHALDLL